MFTSEANRADKPAGRFIWYELAFTAALAAVSLMLSFAGKVQDASDRAH